MMLTMRSMHLLGMNRKPGIAFRTRSMVFNGTSFTNKTDGAIEEITNTGSISLRTPHFNQDSRSCGHIISRNGAKQQARAWVGMIPQYEPAN